MSNEGKEVSDEWNNFLGIIRTTESDDYALADEGEAGLGEQRVEEGGGLHAATDHLGGRR